MEVGVKNRRGKSGMTGEKVKEEKVERMEGKGGKPIAKGVKREEKGEAASLRS